VYGFLPERSNLGLTCFWVENILAGHENILAGHENVMAGQKDIMAGH
jgi:hypothetical protein